jgi:heme exporter protein C
MKLTLALGFLSFTLIAIVLLWWRVRMDLARMRFAELENDALVLGFDQGLDEE